MRLIHAVRELNAEGGTQIETVALLHRRRAHGDVRARGRRRLPAGPGLGAAPTSTTRCSSGPCARPAPTRRGSAGASSPRTRRSPSCATRLGVTFIGPQRRGDAPARRQDRRQADRRGGRRAGRAVEPRRGRRPSRTAPAASTSDRLPADAQGDRRRRRPRHPGGHAPRTSSPTPSTAPATRRQRAFGSGVVFLERLVTGARHVEVQVIADGQGTAWALGVRDCSVQRRNQKVIEESASPVLTAEQAAELKESAERLALAVGYRGAGTVEFLYQPAGAAVRLPRGQHPAAGRAPGHRGDHRPRPRQGCSCTSPPAAGSRASPPLESRPRRRGPAQRRGPRPRLRARARAGSRCCELPGRPGRPGRHRRQRGRRHPRRLRLDDRQDHRLRPRPAPRRWPGCAARCADTTVDHRGRRDEQELPARPARPARGHRRQRRHRLDRPGPHRRDGSYSHRHAGVALVAAGDRGLRGGGAGRARSDFLATAHGGRPQARHEVGRTIDLKLRGVVLPGDRRADRPAPVPGRRGRRRARADRRRRLERLDAYAGRLVVADQRFRLVTATHGAGAPGRGRRRHPPRHPGRGRGRALARARPGRRRPGGGRRTRSRPAHRCSSWRA